MEIALSHQLNQGRFETWTSRPEFPFYHVTQVHGIDIASPVTLPCEADGIIVSNEEMDRPLAIKTADCLPVVIEGEKGVVFVHAGWRGLANGILERPEISMIKPVRAFIGPSIRECCFEVSQDFRTNFPHSSFFKTVSEKLFFGLQNEAQQRMQSKFPELKIEQSPRCTCCDLAFHSYRRNKTTERNWNLYIKG